MFNMIIIRKILIKTTRDTITFERLKLKRQLIQVIARMCWNWNSYCQWKCEMVNAL